MYKNGCVVGTVALVFSNFKLAYTRYGVEQHVEEPQPPSSCEVVIHDGGAVGIGIVMYCCNRQTHPW